MDCPRQSHRKTDPNVEGKLHQWHELGGKDFNALQNGSAIGDHEPIVCMPMPVPRVSQFCTPRVGPTVFLMQHELCDGVQITFQVKNLKQLGLKFHSSCWHYKSAQTASEA